MAKYKVEITGIKTANLKAISNEETINLIKEYRLDNKKETLEKIIIGNMKLVLSVMKSFSNRCDNQDDLFQIGTIGLMKAINNFEIDYNLKFSTYAVPMIIGEIKRYLRDDTQVRISRQIKDLAYKSLKMKEEYLETNSEEPDNETLAKLLNVDKKDLQEAMDSTQSVVSIYDTAYGEGDENILIIDQLSDENVSLDKTLNYITLKEGIKTLTKTQKEVIKNRYYLGKTQFEIADEFNISQAQVSRIEKSAIDSLKSFFF